MLLKSEDMFLLFKEFAHVTMNVQFRSDLFYCDDIFVNNDDAF